MSQSSLIRIEVPLEEVKRKKALGQVIEYCSELAGYGYDKELERALGNAGVPVDNTQLTRWKQGAEGIKWPKLVGLMDVCGNDAPVLWMMHQRGYDLHSIRRLETDTEQQLRLAREELEQERMKNRVLVDALHGRSSA